MYCTLGNQSLHSNKVGSRRFKVILFMRWLCLRIFGFGLNFQSIWWSPIFYHGPVGSNSFTHIFIRSIRMLRVHRPLRWTRRAESLCTRAPEAQLRLGRHNFSTILSNHWTLEHVEVDMFNQKVPDEHVCMFSAREISTFQVHNLTLCSARWTSGKEASWRAQDIHMMSNENLYKRSR